MWGLIDCLHKIARPPKYRWLAFAFGLLGLCLWNVGGLISKQFNKTADPEFLRKIDNFNLLFLVETHLEPDHDISKIGSYYCNLILDI
jgi:hypothetical protein